MLRKITGFQLGTARITGIVTTIGDPGADTNAPTEQAIREALALYERWKAAGSFTRASDSTFTVTDNATNQAIFVAGRPIRYRATAGTWYYGMVVSYSSGTVTLSGIALTTSVDDEMQYGNMEMVRAFSFHEPGNAVVENPYAGRQMIWKGGSAYCVHSSMVCSTAPTGANLTYNVEVAGSSVHTSDIAVSTTSETTSGVTLASANYKIVYGNVWNLKITQVGSTIPGGNPVKWNAVFVYE